MVPEILQQEGNPHSHQRIPMTQMGLREAAVAK